MKNHATNPLAGLPVLGATPRAPHKQATYALATPTTVIRTSNKTRVGGIVYGIRVIADEYASRESDTLGQLVRTVNVEFIGRQIMNHKMKGHALPSAELEELNKFLEDNDPTFSEGELMILVRGNYEYSAYSARKGKQLLQFNWKGSADPRKNTLPTYEETSETGKTTTKIDRTVLRPFEEEANRLLDNILHDLAWQEIVKPVDQGGYIPLQKVSDADASQDEDVLAEMKEMEAAAKGTTVNPDVEVEI